MSKNLLTLLVFLFTCQWEAVERNCIASPGQAPLVEEDDTVNGDSCVLSLGNFVPTLEKQIRSETPADSMVQKAALEILSGLVKKGRIRLSAGKTFSEPGKCGEFQTEPEKGEIESSGVKWQWNLKVFSLGDQTCLDARPPFFRFRCRVYFTIQGDLPGDENLCQVYSDSKGWHYIVAGAGKDQDATVVPKNAPKEDMKSGK